MKLAVSHKAPFCFLQTCVMGGGTLLHYTSLFVPKETKISSKFLCCWQKSYQTFIMLVKRLIDGTTHFTQNIICFCRTNNFINYNPHKWADNTILYSDNTYLKMHFSTFQSYIIQHNIPYDSQRVKHAYLKHITCIQLHEERVRWLSLTMRTLRVNTSNLSNIFKNFPNSSFHSQI